MEDVVTFCEFRGSPLKTTTAMVTQSPSMSPPRIADRICDSRTRRRPSMRCSSAVEPTKGLTMPMPKKASVKPPPPPPVSASDPAPILPRPPKMVSFQVLFKYPRGSLWRYRCHLLINFSWFLSLGIFPLSFRSVSFEYLDYLWFLSLGIFPLSFRSISFEYLLIIFGS